MEIVAGEAAFYLSADGISLVINFHGKSAKSPTIL